MRYLIVFLLSLPYWASANNISSSYIATYKDIAISEMHRTGIPASIKLAQGLLESDWGRSDLATRANNHFGIKCGGKWKGDTYYKEDDDKDRNGRLIESCFRSFDNAFQSYVAHSEFLTDPKKKDRYGMLFLLDKSDYKSWAKGLRKAGYATDPNYPKKLIEIIEKYQLHAFDYAVPSKVEEPIVEIEEEVVEAKEEEQAPVFIGDHKIERAVVHADYRISKINRCRYVKAVGGESIDDIARASYTDVDEILRANEMYHTPDDVLESGALVFLDQKKRRYNGEKEFHEVQEGETMESISQLYGIRLQSLYAKNKIPSGAEVLQGEKLSLQKTVRGKDRPKFTKEDMKRNHEFLFEGEKI